MRRLLLGVGLHGHLDERIEEPRGIGSTHQTLTSHEVRGLWHTDGRVLLQQSAALQEECKEFLAKTKQFNDIVGDFIDVMESKSKVIEAEKLRAIGLGNRVEHEKEVRKRKEMELKAMINEKKAELERMNTQHDSLQRVEAEQKALIEKLTNNEA